MEHSFSLDSPDTTKNQPAFHNSQSFDASGTNDFSLTSNFFDNQNQTLYNVNSNDPPNKLFYMDSSSLTYDNNMDKGIFSPNEPLYIRSQPKLNEYEYSKRPYHNDEDNVIIHEMNIDKITTKFQEPISFNKAPIQPKSDDDNQNSCDSIRRHHKFSESSDLPQNNYQSNHGFRNFSLINFNSTTYDNSTADSPTSLNTDSPQNAFNVEYSVSSVTHENKISSNLDDDNNFLRENGYDKDKVSLFKEESLTHLDDDKLKTCMTENLSSPKSDGMNDSGVINDAISGDHDINNIIGKPQHLNAFGDSFEHNPLIIVNTNKSKNFETGNEQNTNTTDIHEYLLYENEAGVLPKSDIQNEYIVEEHQFTNNNNNIYDYSHNDTENIDNVRVKHFDNNQVDDNCDCTSLTTSENDEHFDQKSYSDKNEISYRDQNVDNNYFKNSIITREDIDNNLDCKLQNIDIIPLEPNLPTSSNLSCQTNTFNDTKENNCSNVNEPVTDVMTSGDFETKELEPDLSNDTQQSNSHIQENLLNSVSPIHQPKSSSAACGDYISSDNNLPIKEDFLYHDNFLPISPNVCAPKKDIEMAVNMTETPQDYGGGFTTANAYNSVGATNQMNSDEEHSGSGYEREYYSENHHNVNNGQYHQSEASNHEYDRNEYSAYIEQQQQNNQQRDHEYANDNGSQYERHAGHNNVASDCDNNLQQDLNNIHISTEDQSQRNGLVHHMNGQQNNVRKQPSACKRTSSHKQSPVHSNSNNGIMRTGTFKGGISPKILPLSGKKADYSHVQSKCGSLALIKGTAAPDHQSSQQSNGGGSVKGEKIHNSNANSNRQPARRTHTSLGGTSAAQSKTMPNKTSFNASFSHTSMNGKSHAPSSPYKKPEYLKHVQSKVGSLPTNPPSNHQQQNMVHSNNAAPNVKSPSTNINSQAAFLNEIKTRAKSKIGSLENAAYVPSGGRVKIQSYKLDFKKEARSKIRAEMDAKSPSANKSDSVVNGDGDISYSGEE